MSDSVVLESRSTKVCSKCKEEKDLDFFHNNKSRRDGKGHYCKPCDKIKKKERGYKFHNFKLAEKRCAGCDITKITTEFYKDKYKTFGVGRLCRLCVKINNDAQRIDFKLADKKCKKCGDIKSTKEFQFAKGGKYGVRGSCRDCMTFSKRNRKVEFILMDKECTKCKIVKSSLDFHKSTQKNHGTASSCKLCEKERKAKFHIKHPYKGTDRTARRRSNKLQATPPWSEKEKIKLLYKKAKWLESVTGLKYHIDHSIPLKGKNCSGLHCWMNLQLLEASINLSKGNRY